ncbi:MAG: SUF system NifU family Fe-S cluster assembly protein [Erysipelotrichales bacterium]|nr:SUF system NifU family Fe-S cluster assembly protein [Erysipelotrichales bacterium]MBQ1385316.1 SUF system NifU family Fe-S cluster assembly protein [Erysipelotrichales bacterium]MBQ2479485.1 SUF system NifU family Fe-S cluster assembly protein [Erysipelotrichales bacterium]MBQ4011630.1 SUF system NifU family Fe-S cluster assembly protein [Erysipelotrichales bacterium]MBQ4375986.1 SUF system NifU family Fe-S cluster assembly protein [Erysipelotrichales bacterium]
MDSMLKDPSVLREIIMDHYQYPRNKELSEDKGYKKVHMASDSCIDNIYVQGKVENGVIQDLRFDGIGCTLSTASTSILTEMLKGKTLEEAQKIMQEYSKMISGEPFDEDLLEEAVAFRNVYRQPNRVHCATIGLHGIDRILKGENDDE